MTYFYWAVAVAFAVLLTVTIEVYRASKDEE